MKRGITEGNSGNEEKEFRPRITRIFTDGEFLTAEGKAEYAEAEFNRSKQRKQRGNFLTAKHSNAGSRIGAPQLRGGKSKLRKEFWTAENMSTRE